MPRAQKVIGCSRLDLTGEPTAAGGEFNQLTDPGAGRREGLQHSGWRSAAKDRAAHRATGSC